jgi:hypothetical protein
VVCKHLERWRTERIGINAPLLGSKSRLRLRPIEISALLVGQNVSGDRGPIALALAWCPVLQSHQNSFTGRQRRHSRHSRARGQASGRICTAIRKRVDRFLKDLADILSLCACASIRARTQTGPHLSGVLQPAKIQAKHSSHVAISKDGNPLGWLAHRRIASGHGFERSN